MYQCAVNCDYFYLYIVFLPPVRRQRPFMSRSVSHRARLANFIHPPRPGVLRYHNPQQKHTAEHGKRQVVSGLGTAAFSGVMLTARCGVRRGICFIRVAFLFPCLADTAGWGFVWLLSILTPPSTCLPTYLPTSVVQTQSRQMAHSNSPLQVFEPSSMRRNVRPTLNQSGEPFSLD